VVRMRRPALAAIALLLAGCAASDPGGEPPAQTVGALERRHQATATVLQRRDREPQLCLTAFATAGLVPACRGLPIPNWRWDQVPGEQAANGTIWGRYQLTGLVHYRDVRPDRHQGSRGLGNAQAPLVGSYDGASFTVTRAALAPPERQPSHQEQFKHEPKPGCPEPAGGWAVPDPARRSDRYLEPVTRMARARPGFAGLWLSYLAPMGDNVAEDPGEFVLNVAFTGDLARHEAELRPRWGGRLCVTRQQRSHRQLVRIQRDLHGEAGSDLGLWVLGSGIRESANAVTLEVVVLEERAREALEARYGAGAVQVTAVLTPVA
jgi:hypothetical protein